MSRGRSAGWIALIVGAVLVACAIAVAVLLGAAGAGVWLLGEGAPGPSDEDEGIAGMVALGEGRAVFVQGYGISEPMIVRGVRVDGGALREDWRWSAPAGMASHGWAWRRAGGVVVGELHASQSQAPHRLACFTADGGFAGEVAGVSDGAWMIASNGAQLLARTRDALVLVRTSPFGELWRLPVGETATAARVALTPEVAILNDESMRVVRRSDGELVRTLEGERAIVGVDGARGELLRLRDGRVVVEDLESGAERIALDVAEGRAIVDGLDEPALLGRHGGRWILVYATELDHSFTSNTAPSWTRHAPRTLAAVDPDSGAVAWRVDLGPWRRWVQFVDPSVDDEGDLPAELLLYSDADAEGGGVAGHLAYVSLADGALRWQHDYTHATRGNALFARIGDVAYLRIREANEGPRSALARFEDGRLTSAVWLSTYSGDVRTPMLLADEAWIPTGPQSWALVGPDLRARAHGGPDPVPTDARQWALDRLGLSDR